MAVTFEGRNRADPEGHKRPVPDGMGARLRTGRERPRCALTGYAETKERPLQVDHKAAHDAWAADLQEPDPDAYQLLTVEAQQQKRQPCRECAGTGRRPDAREILGYPVGWTQGGPAFETDGAGCLGRIFFNPRAFRARPPRAGANGLPPALPTGGHAHVLLRMTEDTARRAIDVSDADLLEIYEETFGPAEAEPMARLKRLRDVLAEFGQTWNSALLDPDILLHPDDKIPTARTELAVLATCWRRNCPKAEYSKIAPQTASQCRNLRNRFGVVFVGTGRAYVEQDDDLGQTRRIQGFQTDVTAEDANLIRLNARQKSRFLAGQRDPMTGSSSTLEIDHRTPVAAARKAGVAPDTLSPADLEDGSAHERFQALNKTTNARKREVCRKCLEGEEIEIPPVAAMDRPAGHWRTRFEDPRAKDLPPEAPPCLGCFWHRPEHSFAQACARWAALHAVSETVPTPPASLRDQIPETTFPTPPTPPSEA